MSTYIPMRVKQLIYPKAHGKNKKSIDSSSKSTRAASKNILALENKKLNIKNKRKKSNIINNLVTRNNSGNINPFKSILNKTEQTIKKVKKIIL